LPVFIQIDRKFEKMARSTGQPASGRFSAIVFSAKIVLERVRDNASCAGSF